jgi:hypothetical protein
MRHVSSFRPSGEPAMTKTVLLARPHPFIAAEMRSFRILGPDAAQRRRTPDPASLPLSLAL